MSHLVHDPIESLPLDAFGSVERRVSLRYRRTVATAEVRAGWARIEVRMNEPSDLAGIAMKRDRSGLAAALSAQSEPSSRFTYNGELTARAIRLAQRFIIRVLDNHAFVEQHAQEVAERCIAAQQRIERIEKQILELEDTGERAVLRRAFKRGELTQKEYQSIVREISDRRASRSGALEAAIREETADIARRLDVTRISLEHALIHLRHPNVVSSLPEDLRAQLARSNPHLNVESA